MHLRNGLYVAAATAFVTFWISGFAREDSMAYIVSCVLLLIASLVSWVGAVYTWAIARQSARSSLLTLVVIVPMGFICGWLYILLRGHELTRARSIESVSK